MKATIPFLERKFEEFNQKMFEGKLPKLPMQLSDAKSFLGKCVFKRRVGSDGREEFYDFKLRINTRLDLQENEIEDVIIHEMIHYYIGYFKLEDTSAHGPVFMHIMNEINAKYGRNLSVSHKSTDEQKEHLLDKKAHYHVVAVIVFHDGRTGIKVLPRIAPRILNFYNKILASKDILAIQLYMTNDIFFNRFPNSSALRVHYLEPEEIKSHIKGARKLDCDGDIISNA